MSEKTERSLNFIEEIVEQDLKEGKHDGRILTRFPPEPNGYLHIGHTKAICLNFELAAKYGGQTNLRFDDTNPTTEDTEYVLGIQEDIKWLGFEWNEEVKFTSDYFPQLYSFAVKLIKKGLAYVDDSTSEQIAEMKGSPTVVGTNSPFRDRTVEENLDLFERMKKGEFEDGARVLRAKIDMSSPNLLMRDPIMYRIKNEAHHRTGDEWCIYPMYDFAHGQSDSIENVTHSLCSLEFIHHRPLYDWFIENLDIYPSRQTEFSRMNVEYMITSKRKMLKLIENGIVSGWDDPRMPTVRAMKRKGYPPMALRNFCEKVGMTKRDNLIELSLLESCVRDILNKEADRAMVVEDPIKVIITNYPEGQTEYLPAENNPEQENSGVRQLPFSREIFVERRDFMEDAPRKYFRLSPGRNVRLKHAYIVHCEGFAKDDNTGEVREVYCSYYPDSKSGEDNSGIKAKGTLHWVESSEGVAGEIRNYDPLFTDPNPAGHRDKDFMDFINEESINIVEGIMEPSLASAQIGKQFQFLRKGYYCVDKDSTEQRKVFNRTVTLKDSFKKKNN